LLTLINSDEAKGKWNSAISFSTEEEALNNIFLDDYHQSLSQLPEMERQVLERYFDELGIHSEKVKEIGKDLGITPNKVYKVKSKALTRLRNDPIMQSYLED